jgi:hypothetical protein
MPSIVPPTRNALSWTISLPSRASVVTHLHVHRAARQARIVHHDLSRTNGNLAQLEAAVAIRGCEEGRSGDLHFRALEIGARHGIADRAGHGSRGDASTRTRRRQE